jgi:hypothetical protein
VIEVMAEGDEDADQAIKILRKFDEASFTSDMLSMKSKLTFKDKKTNALKQIVDLSVEMAGEFGIGNDFEDKLDPEAVDEAGEEGVGEAEEAPRKK